MATSNLKRIAAETLGTWLATEVPALAGKIHTVSPEPTERGAFPCVVILARTMRYQPMQADEVWWSTDVVPDPNDDEDDDPETDPPDIDDGKVVMNVGAFTGVFELRIYAKSVAERESLEDKVLHAFLKQELRPGIVSLTTPTLTINEYVTLYAAPVAFMLDEEEWREEFAFENRRFSFLDLDVEFPALAVRDAYRIEHLQTAINHDLDSDVPDEAVEIDDDGNTSKV